MFKIFLKSSLTAKPWKSAFNSPDFWNDYKSESQIFWNIHSDIMRFFKYFSKMFSVSIIKTYLSDYWIIEKYLFKGKYSTVCVMDIYRMYINSKDISYNVCYDMSFYSFCFFSRHIIFYHCDMLFLHFANQLMHNFVLLFFLLVF